MDYQYPIKLIFNPALQFSEAEFFQFCQDNHTQKFERDAQGNIIVMAPTGLNTSHYNNRLAVELGIWNKEKRLGILFDSNAGFTLPNGAVRSPDVAFVIQSRWEALSAEDKAKFGRICPDFVIELRSLTDALPNLQAKMQEWIANGCRLAWLIDPAGKQVFIYRADGSVTTQQGFETPLSGEDVLPGLVLDLQDLLT